MSSWHDEMAAAVNTRKLALSGVERWQKKLAAADHAILKLSAARPVPGEVPSAGQITEQVAESIPATLNPVFGVSTEVELNGHLGAGTQQDTLQGTYHLA